MDRIDSALAITSSAVDDLLSPKLLATSAVVSDTRYVTSRQARSTAGLLDWMFELTKVNMREMYEACPGWGWDDEAKREELGHDDSRYFVIRQDAFVHLRYEMEDDLPVVYVYEIQVDARQRGRRLGRNLMEAVESLAWILGFTKVMLTVFANNIGARRFYEARGYEEDASSPVHGAGYFILSKTR